jgi:hypothetical protein
MSYFFEPATAGCGEESSRGSDKESREGCERNTGEENEPID